MRFNFRIIPFIAMLALVALGISLGQWQDRRAAGKLALQAQLAERSAMPPSAVADQEFRRVRVSGTWLREWVLYLDNRPQNGRAGFYVLMPLRLSGTNMHVLVARGWIPRDAQVRERIAAYDTPEGEVTVEGIARANLGHVMQLGEAAALKPGAIVQNADAAQWASASGLAAQPFIVEQTGGAADKLVRDWPAPSLGVDKHKGYAFQWYALAVMAFLFFVITGFRSGRPTKS